MALFQHFTFPDVLRHQIARTELGVQTVETTPMERAAVADIGGQRFYAWVITVYLVGSVVAATAVNPLLMRFGPRTSYLLILSVFGAGTLACAIAPSMELLLVARTVQV